MTGLIEHAEGELPVPRMQLRWTPSTKRERRAAWCEVPGVEAWTCHHEMVLPLCRGDMRRGRKGDASDDLLIVAMGKTTTLGDKPWHAPFRDDAHSRLDARALGLPVYLIDTSGNATLQHPSSTASTADPDREGRENA